MSQRPEYIDIHSHVNFSAYDADREEVLAKAKAENVWMINIGTKEETSRKAVEIAKTHDGVFAIIGLHPVHVNPSFHDKDELGDEGKPFTSKGEDFDPVYYRKLAKSKKVVGIGECGLDFFHEPDEAGRLRQEEMFRRQIELSLELGLPLMLHVRHAYKEVLVILRKYPGAFGNVHFFAGSVADEKEFLDLGFTISFTGVITFAKEYEDKVKSIPSDKILSETDCPYVTPAPHRGKRNEPLFVKHVADTMARIRGEVDVPAFRKQLVENAFNLFKL